MSMYVLMTVVIYTAIHAPSPSSSSFFSRLSFFLSVGLGKYVAEGEAGLLLARAGGAFGENERCRRQLDSPLFQMCGSQDGCATLVILQSFSVSFSLSFSASSLLLLTFSSTYT